MPKVVKLVYDEPGRKFHYELVDEVDEFYELLYSCHLDVFEQIYYWFITSKIVKKERIVFQFREKSMTKLEYIICLNSYTKKCYIILITFFW